LRLRRFEDNEDFVDGVFYFRRLYV